MKCDDADRGDENNGGEPSAGVEKPISMDMRERRAKATQKK